SYSYATHDWEIVPGTDEVISLVNEFKRMREDPRITMIPQDILHNNPHHLQFSLLSLRSKWREFGRWANQIENYVRGVFKQLSPNHQPPIEDLHFMVFKACESDFGYGWQQLHYDYCNHHLAKGALACLLYGVDTMSTAFPLYDKKTMAPAFGTAEVATPTEEENIKRLIRDEHFNSFPVKLGDAAFFAGTVCHRGVNNPNHERRLLFYLLLTEYTYKAQDHIQRFPILQPMYAELSKERRWAIIAYYKIGFTVEAIQLAVGCTRQTVYHWLTKYAESQSVDNAPRSGRPKKLIPSLKEEAEAHPFNSTPRMLKAKLHIDASKRTIRRRLNDDGLFGRVSRHFFVLTPATIAGRLRFANGYSHWTAADWMRVIFSDEKIFTLGMHGQVQVQRPRGKAYDPKYVREQESHPAGINFWCCFSGHGTGGCETFRYNNTGKVMRAILDFHLIVSANKFWDSGMWWLLWDNSPIHKSKECQTWLHNHGVICLELSAYSPDCNPTENLLDDMARRVEQRYPSTLDELEDAIHAEWPLTNQLFLSHLAQSMPRRIQAVITNQGHATKY
ncbi:MAG TPA: transposase, partial [Candidatus Babeliaceae bacterium]|nr:transposase [Candidatus Babeliaceae bacterium]